MEAFSVQLYTSGLGLIQELREMISQEDSEKIYDDLIYNQVTLY